MKKNNIMKTAIGFITATVLIVVSSSAAFAPAEAPAQPTRSAVAFTPIARGCGFFLPEDNEGYCYQIGDEVEVKISISRGYYTVRCKITDRKSDWFNGNQYYVVPISGLSDLQSLFFSEGWIHEPDIQTINPQPVFKAIWDIITSIKSLF